MKKKYSRLSLVQQPNVSTGVALTTADTDPRKSDLLHRAAGLVNATKNEP